MSGPLLSEFYHQRPQFSNLCVDALILYLEGLVLLLTAFVHMLPGDEVYFQCGVILLYRVIAIAPLTERDIQLIDSLLEMFDLQPEFLADEGRIIHVLLPVGETEL